MRGNPEPLGLFFAKNKKTLAPTGEECFEK
jgi:hypothetical protein